MKRAVPWLVLAGVLTAALSLRAPIIAVTPVLPDIITDLGITESAAGLFTTAPVLMFAVLTPVAAVLIRRGGPELALLLSLCGVLLGTLIRVLPGYGSMLIGMLVIGAAITVGNVVIPVIIRRDLPPERAATATAVYAAVLNFGSLLTALGTAPLAQVMGWRFALMLWGVLTLAGLALWLIHMRRSRGSAGRLSGVIGAEKTPIDGDSEERFAAAEAMTGPMPVIVERDMKRLFRRPVLWLLAAAFAVQSSSYYGLSTWLPTVIIDTTGAKPEAAGAISSLFQGVAIIGALLAPLFLRYLGSVLSGALAGACWITMIVGILVAPESTWIWASFGAIAHAAGFVFVFTALVRVARSDAEAAGMSAVVQGSGYLFAAAGAPLLGALHELSGNWEAPLLASLGAVICYTVLMVIAMLAVGREQRNPRN